MRLVPPTPAYADVVAGWSRSPDETEWWCSRREHPLPADVVRGWWTEPDVQAWLLLTDTGIPMGYGEIWLDVPADEVELARLIVAPEARHRGVGRAMVAALLERSARTGLHLDGVPAAVPARLPAVDVDLDPVRRMVAQEDGLATVAVVRGDGTPHSSLVNAGVLDHPLSGRPVVAYVTYGAVKLRHLATRPATSLLWRAGWRWAAVDGTSELLGPGDTDVEELRLLLRAIFTAAGGAHDDWDTYDRVMRDEGRVAVLVAPTRVYGSG